MSPRLPVGSRVLLDTVALVYFLEHHERYGGAAREVLSQVESGEATGLVSSLVFAELLVPLYRSGEARAAADLVDSLTSFRNLEVVPATIEVMTEAARLRAAHGLRTPDAIHGATALVAGGDGILTNDRHFDRLSAEGLRIWRFQELAGPLG